MIFFLILIYLAPKKIYEIYIKDNGFSKSDIEAPQGKVFYMKLIIFSSTIS